MFSSEQHTSQVPVSESFGLRRFCEPALVKSVPRYAPQSGIRMQNEAADVIFPCSSQMVDADFYETTSDIGHPNSPNPT